MRQSAAARRLPMKITRSPTRHFRVCGQRRRSFPHCGGLRSGILIVNERKGRIQEADTGLFLQALAQFRIRVDRQPEQSFVLRAAREHNLSVYDAAYLELAYREKVPLATLDRRLADAARRVGVALF